MWVTVVKKFADKYTGDIYMPGDKLNLKRTASRRSLL